MKRITVFLVILVLCMTLMAKERIGVPQNTLSGAGTISNPYLVEDFDDLVILSSDNTYWASGTYIVQTGDINAVNSTGMNQVNGIAEGFIPIGNSSSPFFGNYDGQNYTITHLNIHRNADNQGLFGFTVNATIANVSLSTVHINGGNYVGGILGKSATNTRISNCSVSGIITGDQYIGGIVGSSPNGHLENCTTEIDMHGTASVGGCIAECLGGTVRNCSSTGIVEGFPIDNSKQFYGGVIAFANNSADISLCSSSARVIGNQYAGGIAGYLTQSTAIDSSYAFGQVSGYAYVGGLLGYAFNVSYIRDCFATGDVTASSDNVGAFVGSIAGPSSNTEVSNSYALGNVDALAWVSGFIGFANNIDIDNCYSIGSVSAATGAPKYGFAYASNNYTCENSFWDVTYSNIATSHIGTGLTTSEMQTLSTYTDAGWDFVGESANGDADHWKMDVSKNNGYPYLAWAEAILPNQIICPQVTNRRPENNTSGETTDQPISWNSLPFLTGYTRGYDIFVTIQVGSEIDTLISNIESDEQNIAYPFEGDLPYSAIVRWTVNPYYKIHNLRTYPTTPTEEFKFSTQAGIEPEIPNENNPISKIVIDIPDGADPYVPVILEDLPTEGFDYQPVAAFSYNFDIIGTYNIELYGLDEYMFFNEGTGDVLGEDYHLYVGSTELTYVNIMVLFGDPEFTPPAEGFWSIYDKVYVFYNYDGSKGDKEIVIANNDPQTLPVTLSAFNAMAYNNEYVSLNWTTQSESNLLGFNVLRAESQDLSLSQRVNSSIISASNTSQTANYTFVDKEVSHGSYYYWLEVAELANENSYHGPISVTLEEDTEVEAVTATEFSNFGPSPFTESTSASLRVKEGEIATISVYNLKGQLVSKEKFSAGQHNFTFSGRDTKNKEVANGIYFVKMTSPSTSKVTKIIKIK